MKGRCCGNVNRGREKTKTAFNTYTTVSCNVMLKLKIQSTKEMEEESKEGGIIDTSYITYSHYIT